MDAVATATSVKHAHTILSRLPSIINQAYDGVFDRIKARASKDEDSPPLLGIAQRALFWVTYSLKPLSVDALREAIGIKDPDNMHIDDFNKDRLDFTRIILLACAGLLVIDPKDEVEVVRLVHYTAQTYLRGEGSIYFALNELWTGYPHCWMAYKSVSYLCLLFHNKSRRTDLGFYIHRNWDRHACEESHMPEALQNRILEYFALLISNGRTCWPASYRQISWLLVNSYSMRYRERLYNRFTHARCELVTCFDLAARFHLKPIVKYLWKTNRPSDDGLATISDLLNFGYDRKRGSEMVLFMLTLGAQVAIPSIVKFLENQSQPLLHTMELLECGQLVVSWWSMGNSYSSTLSGGETMTWLLSYA